MAAALLWANTCRSVKSEHPVMQPEEEIHRATKSEQDDGVDQDDSSLEVMESNLLIRVSVAVERM